MSSSWTSGEGPSPQRLNASASRRERRSYLWASIALLLILAAWLLPPTLIGLIAQRDVMRMVARSADAPVQARLVSYQRDLFSADAVIELRRYDSPPIVVSLDVRHGPLLPRSTCGEPLGLAVASGEILPATENGELIRLYGDDPLPVLCVFSDLSGDGRVEIQIPAHGATTFAATGEQREFAWDRMTMRLFEEDTGFRMVLTIPHLEIAQLFRVANLRTGQPMYGQWDHSFHGVTVNQSFVTDGSDTRAFSELSVATFNATRTVFEPEAFAELQGLHISSDTGEVAGILDWTGNVSWDAIIFPDWHAEAGEIPLQLLNIDATALREMNLATSLVQRREAAERLIEMGPVFRVGPASQQIAAGGMELDVAVLIHPGPVMLDMDPAHLVQRVEGRFDLTLPVGFIYGMVRDRYEDEATHEAVARNLRASTFQISRMAEERFDADLARVATRGLMRRDGEHLVFDLTLTDGYINTEAQSEPLLDLIEWLGLLLRSTDDEVET
jgi:hypothetical protein